MALFLHLITHENLGLIFLLQWLWRTFWRNLLPTNSWNWACFEIFTAVWFRSLSVMGVMQLYWANGSWCFAGSQFLHIQRSRCLRGIQTLEDEVITVLWNAGNYSPTDAAPHPRRMDSSSQVQDEGSQFLWNICAHPPQIIVSHPRRW
jgi:hypothetical protein